jgi:hypothetical protein
MNRLHSQDSDNTNEVVTRANRSSILESLMARPTKLTPELQATFLGALGRSYYLETAADLAGIDRRTIYHWLKRGKRARRGPYRGFFLAYKKTLAVKEALNIKAVEESGQWTARAWLLERSNYERWGNHRKELAELQRGVLEMKKSLEKLS